jgi:sarcosine oxidase subunit beta
VSEQHAEVLIIGAGIAGCTIALELAELGTDVLVLEASAVGNRSSALNAGGVRQQFSRIHNIYYGRKSVAAIVNARARLGEPIAHRQVGYLFLYDHDDQRAVFERAVQLQQELGAPSRIVGPREIEELVPGIATDDLIGGAFNPEDGYVDPRATVTAFGRAAQRLGVRFRTDTPVTGLDVVPGRVRAVLSRDERFEADVVVNAAGAWAPQIAAMYGGSLPIEAHRSEIFVVDHALMGGRITPMVLDYPMSMAFHTEGRGILIAAGATTPEPDRPAETKPTENFEELKQRFQRRLPEAAGYGLAQSWAGLVEITPDNSPIVDWTGPDNVFTVAGFSGHGMCLAPGMAADAAHRIRGEAVSEHLLYFSAKRFDSTESLQVEELWSGARVESFGE